MTVIEIPDEQAEALKAKAAAEGLSLEAWLKRLAEQEQFLSQRPTLPQPITDPLLERIRARRDAIESRQGILSASYPLIREDREDR
ncbi:MAG: hypothetical protein ABSF22_01215 [Bryobacteraceae bacterium]|jgi:hypothetical protein